MKLEEKLQHKINSLLSLLAEETNWDKLPQKIQYPPWDLLDLVSKHGEAEQDLNRKPGVNIDGEKWPFWYGEIKGIKGEDIGWPGDTCYLDLFIGSKSRKQGVNGLLVCFKKKNKDKIKDIKILSGFTEDDWKKFDPWYKKYWPNAEIVVR